MKILLSTLFTILLLTGISFSQNVPNGGFESWTSGEPDDWTTNNVANFPVVAQSSIAHSDSFAIRMSAIEFNNNTIGPELRCPGSTGPSNPGFPINQNFTRLSFFYQFDEDVNDEVSIGMTIRDDSANSIASLYEIIDAGSSSWTPWIGNIDYSVPGKNAAYGDLQILILDGGAGTTPSPDSWLMLDDITLSLSTGIEDFMINEGGLKVFPSPANADVQLFLPGVINLDDLDLQVFDVSGKRYDMRSLNVVYSQNRAFLNVAGLDNGVYIIRSADGYYSSKLIVE